MPPPPDGCPNPAPDRTRRCTRRGARNLTKLIARLVGWMGQLCGKEFHDRPTKLRHLRRVHAVDSDAPHALGREFHGAGVDEQVTPDAKSHSRSQK